MSHFIDLFVDITSCLQFSFQICVLIIWLTSSWIKITLGHVNCCIKLSYTGFCHLYQEEVENLVIDVSLDQPKIITNKSPS